MIVLLNIVGGREEGNLHGSMYARIVLTAIIRIATERQNLFSDRRQAD